MKMSQTPAVPRAVAPGERFAPAELQTPMMRREQAFAADDRWVGYVSTEAGDWSGWHHHGEQDTYFYVIRGRLEVEYGSSADRIAIDAGDFAYIPAGVIHRERTAAGGGEVVLVRIGPGPSVVNVDGPG
jgi:uncharacterized RmlC-like cupin family protein